MEKFKEVVVKSLISAPETPLSESHKTRLQDWLSQFTSIPKHTPDHPPYAWMIERAIRELNERGGSSEGSISDFIRKEYDDLPWIHFTMLRDHLARLCQSGELVLSCGRRYMLATAVSERKVSTKRRRKSVKRKKGWDREITQRKRLRKVNGEKSSLHMGDEVGLLFSPQKDHVTSNKICEDEESTLGVEKHQKLNNYVFELLCSQQKDLLISKEVHQEACSREGNKQQMLKNDESVSSEEKCHGASQDVNEERERIMDGSDQQKSKIKVRTGTTESVAEGNGISDVPLNKPTSLLIIDEDYLQKFRMQQPADEPIADRIDCATPNAQVNLGLEQPEDSDTELATPEEPPGFESLAFEQSSQFQPQIAVSSGLLVHHEQPNQNHAHGISDAHGKRSEPEIIFIKDSLPTNRTQRYMRRKERLPGDETFSLPSAELLDGYHPKPELCDQDRAHSKCQTSVKRQRKKRVAQGNQTSRVLRSQAGNKQSEHESVKPEYPIHLGVFSAVKPDTEVPNVLTFTTHHTKQGLILKQPRSKPSKGATRDKLLLRQYPKKQPDTKVSNELTLTIHQIEQDLLLKRPKSKLSKGAIGHKSLSKHYLKKEQLGIRSRGWSHPKSSIPDGPFTGQTVTSNDLEDQQPDGDRPQLPVSSLKNKTKRDANASTVVRSSLKKMTTYRGVGRPRLTDRKSY